MSQNNNDEARRLAWVSIVQSAVISIGASIMAVGMSIWFVILPLLREMIKEGSMSDQDAAFIGFLNNSVLYFTFGGIAMIAMALFVARTAIHRR